MKDTRRKGTQWTVLLMFLAGTLSLTASCSDDEKTADSESMLEGLCGATYEEIVADYLKTYDNYYKVTPEKDPSVCQALLTLRLNPCLMHYAGVSDEALLPDVDYAKAFAAFLLAHGMSQQQLDALVQALTASGEQ